MMLYFDDTRITTTLHREASAKAIALVSTSVARTIRATDKALKRLGIERDDRGKQDSPPMPAKASCSLDDKIIKPAMDMAAAEELRSSGGPYGADTMFHMPGFDAFVVMLRPGHIAAKLMARHAARSADHRHADRYVGCPRHRP